MIRPAAVVFLLLTVLPIGVRAQSGSPQASNEGATQHPKNSLPVHSEAQSASDTISIGSTTLKLGMSKDEVLSDLGKHYLLENPIPTDWYIHPKSDNGTLLGGVRFNTSGKLSKAWKVWTPEEKDYTAAEIAEVIHRIADKYVTEGNTACSLETSSSLPAPGPGHLEMRTTVIRCGHKNISITLSWKSGPGNVQVNEGLGDETNP